ncbi:MAG TPA: efflux RND transporter permease subunit [Magnetospirillaceae bacterium]|nr:efflux RND transporter permease subunit [Magnetospirillaceae bacterium]
MSAADRVVDRPVLISIVFGLVAIVGLYTLDNIALDLMPESEMPRLSVSTSYPRASPESVEKAVTAVLESALVNVDQLTGISSSSSEGSSRIILEFDYGTHLESAVNDIRDKLDRVRNALPDDAGDPRIFRFDPNAMPILRIAVSGKRSLEELKELAEDYIAPRLEQVVGIAQVDVTGGREKIVRVELSQNWLDAYNLTLTGVAASLSSQNLDLSGGVIPEGSRNYLVRTTGEYRDVREIADTAVAERNGHWVRLSDLGSVAEGFRDETSTVYIDGEPGIYVSLTRQSGYNSVQAADGVYARLEEISALLPADVSLRVISDETRLIRETIDNLVSSAYWGAALAMGILFLFLRSVKGTLIIGISIPLSMLVTLLAMYLAEITLNMMTMTGLILGVGMIVDASIVILESIYRYRERGAKPSVSAVLGSREMLAAIIASNLTTVVVFIPVIFFRDQLGMVGQLFSHMVFTIVISLLSSLFVAVFLIPVLAGRFLPLSTSGEKPLRAPILRALDGAIEGALEALTRVYRRSLEAAIRHRLTTGLLVAGSLALSVAFLPRMNISLMPPTADDSVTVNVSLPVGTRLSETRTVLLDLQERVRAEVRGIRTLITTVGRGGISYLGQLTIQLPAFAERIDDSVAVRRKLRTFFQDYPDVSFSLSQGRFRGGQSDIEIVLRVHDLREGLETARSIAAVLKAEVPDVAEPAVSLIEGLPQVEVEIDRNRAYSFGVSVQAVASEISASLSGYTATVFRKAGYEQDVVLMLQPADRSKVPDLERIFVRGTNGRVPIANVASLRKSLGPVSISREDQGRVIRVTADIVSGERPDRVEAKIREAIATSVILPEGATLAFEGSWKSITETGRTIILIVTMALLLVFGVMAGQYESFKDPFINLFTIPLLVIGVTAVYMISGQALSTFTAIGVVMLVGIVVNNGIVLVDYTNLLVRRGSPVRKACAEAGESRLRPVLMTTLTTILGLVPLAFFPGENSGMIQPIGLTVIGGLTSSTLITLFFIPVLYSLINEKRVS